MSRSYSRETGSVLVLALLTMLALTLMGMGLGYVGSSQIDIASTQDKHHNTLSAAETGVDVAVSWLRGSMATALPNQPQTFSSTPLGSIAATDPGASLRKLSGTTYSAVLEPMASGAGGASSGVGAEVGNSSAYGATASQTTYYKVTSSSSQDGARGVVVEAILSVTQ